MKPQKKPKVPEPWTLTELAANQQRLNFSVDYDYQRWFNPLTLKYYEKLRKENHLFMKRV